MLKILAIKEQNYKIILMGMLQPLARFEKIRAYGKFRWLDQRYFKLPARQHTPKIAFVSEPKSYTSSKWQNYLK